MSFGERSLTLETLVRLVNRLGVTVDYVLADSVSDCAPNILEQFKQMTDGQPLERKQLAIKVLTGIRRGGKSVLLEQIRDEINSPHTILLNF